MYLRKIEEDTWLDRIINEQIRTGLKTESI